MRSVLVLTIIFIGAAWALAHPSVGMLLWTWVSIMNPHKLTYGAEDFPVAAMIGGATLAGLIFSRDKKLFFLSSPSVALMLFMLWICITYPFSLYPDQSTEMLFRVLKIDFMILVALIVLYRKQHIIALAWVLTLSIGFYGVKGGIFTIASGGNFHVWGPPDSFIAGNNELALALIMIIPILYFLRSQYSRLWIRHTFLIAMILTAIAAIGSQSRGALLAIIAMATLLWVRVTQKGLFAILIITVAFALTSFMPDSWHDRMETISNYQEDGSALGRINAWYMTWNLASHNLFGGGFSIYNYSTFLAYAPNPNDIHAAHSIYFQVLGEHGFVGLILFLLIWFFTWRWAGWLRVSARSDDNTEWASVLGAMIQVSLIGYAVGGAFLSLAYFDLPYNMLVLVVIARRWVEHYQAGVNFDAPQLAAESKAIDTKKSRGTLPVKREGKRRNPMTEIDI